jgi:hypothetical protein
MTVIDTLISNITPRVLLRVHHLVGFASCINVIILSTLAPGEK